MGVVTTAKPELTTDDQKTGGTVARGQTRTGPLDELLDAFAVDASRLDGTAGLSEVVCGKALHCADGLAQRLERAQPALQIVLSLHFLSSRKR
jgi:hypothetical protein